MSEPPFFFASIEGDRTVTHGIPSCRLGHRILGSDGLDSDGIFAEWDWDGERLVVRNDRYGFYPLYYFQKGNTIGVSPSIIRLLMEGAPPDLDHDALSVFLRVGFFIAEDTPFDSIRAVPPDARWEWTDGRLSSVGKYVQGRAHRYSRLQLEEVFHNLFRQAIGRRLPPDGNFVVPLSGGRDSRHILLELDEQGYRPNYCITLGHYPPRSNEDMRIAALVTKALGVRHVVLDQTEPRFRAEWRKNLMTGLCSDEHAWYLRMTDHLMQDKTAAVYDGIAGDVFSEPVFFSFRKLDLFRAERLSELAGIMLSENEVALECVLADGLRKSLNRERAVAHMARELKKHLEAPNPVASFYFWNRTRREIALSPYGLMKDIPRVFSPYLDHDLFDFFYSLTPEPLEDGEFHSGTIRRSYPNYADLPFEDKKAALVDARAHDAQFIRDLARCMLGRIRQPRGLIRGRYVLPRMAYSLISRRYAETTAWVAPLILYLFQLETVASKDLSWNGWDS
ncbi:MAG: asparagine synthetase B family protein [Nitrospirae bacterium]|nr:asparagine synthetase B family protein [Nitrospirota bacterium]